MGALNLLHLFDSVFLIAMAGWVGSLMVLGFGIRPVAERCLRAEEAATFERALAARLFAWGAICGAIALPALVCGPLAVPEMRQPAIGLQAIVILGGILGMFYGGNVLVPALAAFSASPAAAVPLRRRQTTVATLVLIANLGLLVAHAFREPPRSPGIVEPNPQERYQESLRRLTRPEVESPQSDRAPATVPVCAGKARGRRPLTARLRRRDCWLWPRPARIS